MQDLRISYKNYLKAAFLFVLSLTNFSDLNHLTVTNIKKIRKLWKVEEHKTSVKQVITQTKT